MEFGAASTRVFEISKSYRLLPSSSRTAAWARIPDGPGDYLDRLFLARLAT